MTSQPLVHPSSSRSNRDRDIQGLA